VVEGLDLKTEDYDYISLIDYAVESEILKEIVVKRDSCLKH
jgi:hypothetical protein